MTPPILELRNVTKDFTLRGSLPFAARPRLRAVDNVSMAIARGEAVGLVGESGSGKSTLGHMILNLLKPSDGAVHFDGAEISALGERALRPYRRRMQLIFQDPYSSLNPTQSIGAMLGEVLNVHGLARSRRERDLGIADLLDKVGMPQSAAGRYPHEFSGGQRQRIVIARALATRPDFIVADEPVSALDVSIQAQIVRLIESLRKQLGLTMLLVAHDLGFIQYMSDRVGVLYLGRLVEIGPTRRLFSAPRHPYTEMLLSVVPSIDAPRARKRIVPKGEIPSPLSPPSGCVFRTRCSYAIGACADVVPPLRQVGEDHFKACVRDDILGGSHVA